MPEKSRLNKLKDVVSSVFGDNSWLMANWLKKGGDLEPTLQDSEVLQLLLDNFPGEITIANPEFLEAINSWSGIEAVNDMPIVSSTAYLISNYVGKEATATEPHFLEPTIWSLIKMIQVARWQELEEVIAVGRSNTFEGFDPRIETAVKDNFIMADKNKDGSYSLSMREKYRLGRAMKKNRSVLWTAPAATTIYGGLKYDRLTTTSIRRAMEDDDAQLLTMAMQTNEDGTKAQSIAFDEIDLPKTVVLEKKDWDKDEKNSLLRQINYQILLWSLAQIASRLPEEQRGQFIDPGVIQQTVIWTLAGINQEEKVHVFGGFLDQ